jgi:hypothetical protein
VAQELAIYEKLLQRRLSGCHLTSDPSVPRFSPIDEAQWIIDSNRIVFRDVLVQLAAACAIPRGQS